MTLKYLVFNIILAGLIGSATQAAVGYQLSAVGQFMVDSSQLTAEERETKNEKRVTSNEKRITRNDPDPRRFRQGIMLATMTATTIGYGIFSLKYNTARARSDRARLVYLDDVRENAVTYRINNQELDELDTYKAWDAEYDNAIAWRNRTANAGLLTGVIALATVVDAVVTWNRNSADRSSFLDRGSASGDRRGIEFQPMLSRDVQGLRTVIRF